MPSISIPVRKCSELKSPEHGKVVRVWSPILAFETKTFFAHYICDKGYKMMGKPDRVCARGEWTPEPVCRKWFRDM